MAATDKFIGIGLAAGAGYLLWRKLRPKTAEAAAQAVYKKSVREGDAPAEAEAKAEETRDLQREAAANRQEESNRPGRPNPQEEMGFEEKEELRRALEDQERLTGEVDSLKAELEAL